jgi:membrane associated rhomboid family serine protease
MNFDQLHEKLDKELNQHPEKTFIIKSLLMISVLIFTKIFLGGFFLPVISFYYIVYLVYLWIYADKGVWRIIQDNISIISSPQVATRERMTGVAWGTWAIIAINCFMYFGVQTPENEVFLNWYLKFPPKIDYTFGEPISLLVSSYLHADFSHLFGNMCFLWAFGSIVERRIGWKRFIAAYHITGLAGSLFAYTIYNGVLSNTSQSIGASGAITGIMGVFMVRCYFKKMNLPLPAFGILPFNFNLQMNAFIVIGLYTVLDLRGGIKQILGFSSNTAYWDHFGSMLAGLLVAYWMKLSDRAIEERHREIGADVFNGKYIVPSKYLDVGGFAGAEKSLLIALEKDPNNTETLVSLARIHSSLQPEAEGRDYYLKALHLLLERDSPETTAVFKEFFSKYRETLKAEVQYRITKLLYNEGSFDLAARTLEQLIEHPDTPEPLREKALFITAKLLEKMSLNEAAIRYYKQLADSYPTSVHKVDALLRLGELRGSC